MMLKGLFMFSKSRGHSELQQFLKRYPVKTYTKGQLILSQGETPQTALVIKRGVVRIYDINQSGEEKIIALSTENEFLPATSLFNAAPSALYYYEAFTATEVYLVPWEELRQVLGSSKRLLTFVLKMYLSLYIGETAYVNALEQTKARDKLLSLLQYLSSRFGKRAANNLVRIELRLTHQDIARMIGMTRETTAMELGKLKADGIISYQNQRYLLNTRRAAAVLGETEPETGE